MFLKFSQLCLHKFDSARQCQSSRIFSNVGQHIGQWMPPVRCSSLIVVVVGATLSINMLAPTQGELWPKETHEHVCSCCPLMLRCFYRLHVLLRSIRPLPLLVVIPLRMLEQLLILHGLCS